jgi:hypothetical protein
MKTQQFARPADELLEKFRNKVAEIKGKITSEDRAAAASELDIHPVTLSNYLNNRGTNLGTYEKLFDLLSKRIQLREQMVA